MSKVAANNKANRKNIKEAIRIDEAAQAASATRQPAYIDNMWMTAFLSNDEVKPKKITVKQKQQKLISAMKKLPKIKANDEVLRKNLKPYLDEMIKNDKTVKIKPIDAFPKFKSYHLEKIFETQTLENKAARKIQKSWLYSRYIHFLRYTCLAVRMIVRIQKIVRGYICRKRVALLYQSENIVILGLQSHIRKFLSNVKWRINHFIEMQAARKIQRCVRIKINYVRDYEIKKVKSAIKIQAVWRGLTGRAIADKKWLDEKVIPIQTLMRKYLAIKKVNKLKIIYQSAAENIKSCFRHYIASKRLAELLIEREKNYRRDTITTLTAEENLIDENLTKLANRFIQHSYRDQQKNMLKNIKKGFYDIDNKENDLSEMKRQKYVLTPLNIQQGWLVDLEKNIEGITLDLFELKEKYIFETLRQVEDIYFDSEKHAEEIITLVNKVNSLQLWKSQVLFISTYAYIK